MKSTMQPVHIIYLSGFGGRYDSLRLKALRRWRFKDVSVELVPMRWEGEESFEQKLARIDQAIDGVKDKRIVLLGESAGGSMAVHAYARRAKDLHKVMTICGKNSHPETVGENYYRRSPAFRTSMEQLPYSTSLLSAGQTQDFVSIHPLYDPVVPVRETLLASCKQIRLFAVGHLLVIALALTIFAPIVVRAAKRENIQS